MDSIAKTPLQILDTPKLTTITPLQQAQADQSRQSTNNLDASAASDAKTTMPTTGVNINPYPSWSGQGLNPNVATQSTTTLSSDKSTDIATNNVALNSLSQKGVTTDPTTGVSTNADGSVYDPNALQTADTSKEDADIQANFDKMKANTDAVTASQIASIQQRYSQYVADQKKVNDSQLGATTNALLTSGAAQHDVYSNDAIKTRIDQNSQAIQDLESQENDLIASAQAAQATGDNKLLEDINAQIQQTRQNKITATTKMNDDIIAGITKTRENQAQAKVDSSVADVYGSGVTDVPGILSALKAKGIDATAQQISDTLKNIVPSGLDDLVKTLRSNGAPQDIIQKVLASKDINEAYKNAGSYGAGGTGIIGEYNFYKAQAEAKGQIPVDFNSYQNQDANRKNAVAAAGGVSASSISDALLTAINGGLIDPNRINSRTIGIYNDIAKAGVDAVGSHAGAAAETTSIQNLAAYQSVALRTLGVIDKNLPLVASLADKVNGIGVPGIDSFIQGIKSYSGNNPDVIKYINSIKTLRSEYAQMLSKGATATEGDKADAAQAIPIGLSSAGYQALGEQLKLEANNIIDSSKEAINSAKSKTFSNNGSTSSSLIQTEDQAKTSVVSAATNNPDVAKIVYDALNKPDTNLGRVMTYSEIEQYLQATGKIK